MGLDGGTIPSRADILRRSSWRLANTSTSRSTRGGNVDNLPSGEPSQGTKQEQARQKWHVCSLSGENLKEPIVVDELGKVYNRASVVEFLLGEGIFTNNRDELKKNGFGHLKSIKNVFEIHVTRNPNVDSKKATTNFDTTAQVPGLFVCPVTQLETNGMHQFCVLRTCGHVFAEKAFNLFQNQTVCWSCNQPFIKEDVLPINPNEKQFADLEKRLKEKQDREQEKKEKKKRRREEKKEKDSDKKEKDSEKKEKESEKKEKPDKKEKSDKKEKLAIEAPSFTSTSVSTTTTTTTTTSSSLSPIISSEKHDRKRVKV